MICSSDKFAPSIVLGGCHAILEVVDSKVAAAAACEALGGATKVADPTNANRNSALFALANSKWFDSILLGATFSGGEFRWGGNQLVGAYTNWESSNPTDQINNPCVEMLTTVGGNGKWNDIVCDATGLSRGLKTGVICFQIGK